MTIEPLDSVPGEVTAAGKLVLQPSDRARLSGVLRGLRGQRVDVAVTARDGGRCRACGSTWQVHRHHLVPRSQGGKTVESNLALLCQSCHRAAHERTDDGRWMRRTA